MKDKMFTQLYNNYNASILSIIKLYIQDKQTAEDVLQLTFIKIAEHITSYDAQKGTLYTWMRRIPVNTSLDLLKSVEYKQSKSNLIIQDVELNNYPLYINYSWSENIQLQALFAVLTENEKLVLQLFYLNEYSQKETSELLHIPLGTVKSRVKSALQKLRKHCKGDIMYYFM